jgi:TonB family protein
MSKRPSLRSLPVLALALLHLGCGGGAPRTTTAPGPPAPAGPAATKPDSSAAPEPVHEPAPTDELSLGEVGLISGHSSAMPQGKIDHAQDQLSINGALDRELVWRVIEDHVVELEYCYSASKQHDLVGHAAVGFVISNTGEVTISAVHEATDGSDELARCVVRAVARWQFPKPDGDGIVTVVFPFSFAPR